MILYRGATQNWFQLRKGNKIANEYHKNTLKGIRSAINRHLSDIGRDMDIAHDKAFKQANVTLAGKLKQNMALGLSKATQHKALVSPDDLHKISQYLSSISCPVNLRHRVGFNASLHFVSRGLEFHQQLTSKSSLSLHNDKGVEYVFLSHETKQKNWQGGLENQKAPHNKRIVIRIIPFEHSGFFSSVSILKPRLSLITSVKKLFPHHKPLISGT